MEYSVRAYIKRIPTVKLEEFLLQCKQNGEMENYAHVIPCVQEELKKKTTGNGTDIQV